MSSQFLMYWNWEDNDLAHWDGKLDYAGSDQFTRVSPGDVLWIVTIPPDETEHRSGILMLLGGIPVAEIVTTEEAMRKMGGYIWPDAHLHALAAPGVDESAEMTNITHLASSLRFQSERDRLTLDNGRVNAQQLQSLRLLTPESAGVLEEVWREQSDLGGPMELTEDDAEFPEGAVSLRQHLARERNSKFVRLAKQLFKEKHGRLFCQVCQFDFSRAYGPLGEDYIEAHHTIPVSELRPGSFTRPEDLAMVCANCHRMLHRRRPWLAMDELQLLVSSKRS
jgi:HNH endonuclease